MDLVAKVIEGRRRFFAGDLGEDEEWFPDDAHGVCCSECGSNQGQGYSEEYSDSWLCESCAKVQEG